MSLLGIDVGTSATKGVLLDDGGRILAHARAGYRLVVPGPGRAELSAGRVWGATRSVIGSLARTAVAAGSPVRAVCVGGSGDEVVAVDRRGRPVAPVVMAVDRRSEAEGEVLAASLGADELYRRAGLWDLSATPLARFEWLRRHDPTCASRVARLLSWPEWIATRLGVPPVVDPTLAARTLAYDLTSRSYTSPPPGLSEGIWSEVVPTGTSLGAIPAVSAGRLGLGAETRFVVGGFDQAMATLGAGAVGPGVAHDGNGSWEALSLRVPGTTIDDRLRIGRWSVGPSATDPSRHELMTSWTGGSALRWVVGLASGGTAGDAAVGRSLAALPEETGAVAIPDLAESTVAPFGGGGALAALDLATGHADLVLAMLHGLAYRLRDATAGLRSLGVEVSVLRATGGGARSDRWLQLKADATGLPVERPAVREAGAFAAALLAGSAVAALPPPEAAVRELVTVDRRFEPDASRHARHVERAASHRALSDGLAGLDPS